MVIVKLIKIEIEDGMWEVWDSNPRYFAHKPASILDSYPKKYREVTVK